MPALNLPNGYYDLPSGKIANVATFLEMAHAPARPLQRLAPPLALHRVDPTDLPAYRAMFRAVGQDLMWFSRLIMPDGDLTAILSNPKVESFVLTRDNTSVGLLELNFAEEGRCELAFFGLVQEEIGKGAGRALMNEAITRAFEKPIRQLWVHTCTDDNPLAFPFYLRSGFKPYKRMIEIQDDPRLTGYMPESASPRVALIKPE
jgi:GNAT superfamily N-acetyltransferase